MIEVRLSPRAERSLKKLDKKIAITLLEDFCDFVQKDNFLSSIKIKKLVSTDFYRYRSGHYRIIFDINHNIYEIFDVRRRNEKTYKL